ncbi:hypothetical protein M0802_007155 [Mischocyttarus mexicanus]|nr:hypothetical protein M0802_007155 [Mischocyttarus mexicanus]
MTTVIVEQNNILQHVDVVDDNDKLVINDNNEENLMDKIMETSCDNIMHNQSKDDSLKSVLKEMDSEVMVDNNNVDGNVKNISDSDNTDKDILLESNDQSKIVKSSSKNYSSIIDSDSEDSDIGTSSSRRKKNVIDDDSESVISNVSSEKHIIRKKTNKTIVSDDDDDDSVSASQNLIEKEVTTIQPDKVVKRFETLVDSESDEDEIQPSTFVEKDTKSNALNKINKSMTKLLNKKKESNRKGSIRASKSEAMRQIHSETQRLIRETEISLPYHKPKPRTLQEFLNRKKVSVDLPNARTTASKLKMSCAIVSKVLEDKEKEAEEFYKSSDSDEEIEKVENTVPELTVKDVSASLSDIDCIFNENVKKVMTNGTQGSSINKDVSQCQSTINNISEGLFSYNNEVKDTADLSDEIEKTVVDLSENIIQDYDKNDETVVKEILDKLLELVEREVKKYDEDKLEENIVLEKTNEICLEEKENEILEAIDLNISLHKDDNDKLHDQTSNDKRDIETTVLEDTIEKSTEHLQFLPLPDFVVEEEKIARKQLLSDIKKKCGTTIERLSRFFDKHTMNDKTVEETTEISVLHIENTTNGLKAVKRSLLYKKPIIEKRRSRIIKAWS